MIRNDLKRFQKIAMNSTFTKTLDCMYKVEISKENLKTVDLKNHSVHDHYKKSSFCINSFRTWLCNWDRTLLLGEFITIGLFFSALMKLWPKKRWKRIKKFIKLSGKLHGNRNNSNLPPCGSSSNTKDIATMKIFMAKTNSIHR